MDEQAFWILSRTPVPQQFRLHALVMELASGGEVAGQLRKLVVEVVAD